MTLEVLRTPLLGSGDSGPLPQLVYPCSNGHGLLLLLFSLRQSSCLLLLPALAGAKFVSALASLHDTGHSLLLVVAALVLACTGVIRVCD